MWRKQIRIKLKDNLLYEERIKRLELFYWKKRLLGVEKWDVIVLYGIMKDREKVSKG